MITQLHGDCLELLETLPAESVQTIVTSPPYWQLRRYTDDPREIGREATPAAYVNALVAVFRACRRVLRADGTLWINMGDSYSGGKQGRADADRSFRHTDGRRPSGNLWQAPPPVQNKAPEGIPSKNLIGMPWRVAFALQDDGWILRSDIIWNKPNCMPESVTDRPTRAHEYVFLFSKARRYYYDAAAIAEASGGYNGSSFTNGKTHDARAHLAPVGQKERVEHATRNARSVWTIATQPLADEHYAAMPVALADRCIRAGSKPGDTVLDPFAGSGTTLRAALALSRDAIGIDLAYQDMQERRTNGVQIELL